VELMQHFGCNVLIEEWDGASPLPDGALALTNHPNPDKSKADEIYSIEIAKAALQNKTLSVASFANLSA